MRAAAAKAKTQTRKVKRVDTEKRERSLAVIEFERLKYKTFINGINSIDDLLDKHKIQKRYVARNTSEDNNIDAYMFQSDGYRKIAWDIWIALLIIYSIVSIPLKIGFQIESSLDERIFDYIVDDIMANFNTAVLENEKLIVDRKIIALKYFQFWFWLDLISSLPIDTFVELAFVGNNGNGLTALRLIRIIRLIRLLKLVRVFRLRSITDHLESLQINPAIMNVLKLLFQVFFIAHIVSCFWYFLTTGDVIGYNHNTGDKQQIHTWITDHPSIDNGDLGDKYVASLYWTVATMVAVGYGDIHAENIQERIFAIVIMLGGGILFGAIIGETIRVVEGRNPQAKFMKEKLNDLKGYLAEKSFPLVLKKEAKIAYTYYLQKKISFGDQLFNDLPFNLLEKLVYKMFEREIACIKIFQTSDRLFVIKLVQCCQPIHCSLGEILYDFGDVANDFVFIMKGLVSISTVESKTINILAGYATEGNYFMDFEYLMNTLSLARYQVVEQSNLFIIKYAVISEACGDFVESGIRLKEELQRRYKRFKEVLKLEPKITKTLHQKTYLGVFNDNANILSSNEPKFQIEYTRPLFWVDGLQRSTFARHRTNFNLTFFDDNSSNKVRILIRNSSSKYDIVEIPQNELIKKYIINPDGNMKRRWDGIMVLLILYSVLYIPVQIAFDDSTPTGVTIFDNIMDAFFISDILISSRTAYYDDSEDAYMTDPLKIYNNYMKTWFLTDFFSGMPFDSIVTDTISITSSQLVSLRLIKVIRLMRLLKLARLLKLSKYIYKLEDSLDIPPSLFELAVLILRVLLLGHLLACLWWGATSSMSADPWYTTTDFQPQDQPFVNSGTDEKYVASLYWTFTTLATVGYGDFFASNTSERLLNIFVMLIGATTFGYIVANVSSTFGSLNQTQALKRDKMANISSILAEKNVSDNLTRSITNHFKNLYNRLSAYNEEEILSGLPHTISNKIAISIHKETMEKITIFKFIENQSVALHIFNLLQPSNFQYGQVIVKEDTAALEIIFLVFGTAVACKELKGNKKQSYLFNWNTAFSSKSPRRNYRESVKILTDDQNRKLSESRKKSLSMKKTRIQINSSESKYSVVTDDSASTSLNTEIETDNMPSEDKIKSTIDDKIEDEIKNKIDDKIEHTIDGQIEDQIYNLKDEFGREKIENVDEETNSSIFGDKKVRNDKSAALYLTDDEIIELGYEPLARYFTGDFFGHTSMLKEACYHASVAALSPCNTYTLRKSELVKLVINNPPISMILQSAIGKAINSLRHTRGKELVRQERAKFLSSIKLKHLWHRNYRKMAEEKMRKETRRNSLILAPIRRFSITQPKIAPTVSKSKWEVVRKAVRAAKVTATVARMADEMKGNNEEIKSRKGDHFRRALKHSFGMALDTVLNEHNMHYDSDSSHEDEIPKKEVQHEKLHLDSEKDAISRRYSMFSGKFTFQHNHRTITNIGVNLKKIKKKALIHRCHSLSNIATVPGYDEDSVSLLKTETQKINRRASFPSSNNDIWNKKKSRIERVL